ncbi:MAG: lipid-A-disaccharide synthase [Parachlamydiales bacterium]
MDSFDLFIFAGENSADRYGQSLIKEILLLNPSVKILAVAGPFMRKEKIDVLMNMEEFRVMGFIDVISFLPKLIKNFFFLKKTILKLNPKACIFIDYPDFNLRLEKSLRKNGYKNKLVHFISPTIWAWRKKRALSMAKYLDLLLTIFPFEKKYYSNTNLEVKYIGHPLAFEIINSSKIDDDRQKELIGIFPGSRKKEIERNFPIQLAAVKKLLKEDNNLKFAISVTDRQLIDEIIKKQNFDTDNFIFFNSDKNYFYMNKLKIALATSGTINIELALHKIPTIVNFLIKPLDLFIAKNILRINLPFYCIVNILLNQEVFVELYGPNLSIDSLYNQTKKLLYNEDLQRSCKIQCQNLINLLKTPSPSQVAAKQILSITKLD